MDFNKCFSILQERMTTGQDMSGGEVPTPIPVAPSVAAPAITVEFSSSTPLMDLVKIFHDLQADRIKTYAYFDKELDEIITGNYPARYSHICNEVTQKFATLSAAINAIKEEFRSRGNTELSACIANVQSAEKEKLTLVAALHLDRLKTTVLAGSEHLTGTKTEEQERYLAEQVAACQSTIAEAMEELQCCLCDLE